MHMDYQVKTFAEPDKSHANAIPKDRAAQAWLNEVAQQGYKFAGIAASPWMVEQTALATISTFTQSITIVVVRE